MAHNISFVCVCARARKREREREKERESEREFTKSQCEDFSCVETWFQKYVQGERKQRLETVVPLCRVSCVFKRNEDTSAALATHQLSVKLTNILVYQPPQRFQFSKCETTTYRNGTIHW